MIDSKKLEIMAKVVDKKVDLKLVELDGNAFNLMGHFRRQARKEGWSVDEIKSVLDECKTGNYDHLVGTLMDHCKNGGA